jgi:hypothetical protein
MLSPHATGDCHSYATDPAIAANILHADLEISSVGPTISHKTTLDIDLPAMTFQYTTPSGLKVSPNRPLTSADIAQWFSDTGVPMTIPSASKLTQEAHNLLTEIALSHNLHDFDRWNRPRPPSDQAFILTNLRCHSDGHPLMSLAWDPWGIWLIVLLWLTTVRIVVPRSRLTVHLLNLPTETNVIG